MKNLIITLGYALILWVLCGATIAVGRSLTGMETVLIIHALAAPVFASIISFIYFRHLRDTSLIKIAAIFLIVIIVMDAGLVAPVFEKSYAMFTSFLGTWLPFILIFTSVYLTGKFVRMKNRYIVKG